ncbi:unnamed protein product [Pedinophyceae sp. YPF-701]|nr:unnamed protein product [Pedinophyceae sp. YPF-701]
MSGGDDSSMTFEDRIRASGSWNTIGTALVATGLAFFAGQRYAWAKRSTWGYRITNLIMWPTLGVGATMLVWKDAERYRAEYGGSAAMTDEELREAREMNAVRMEVLRRVMAKSRDKGAGRDGADA